MMPNCQTSRTVTTSSSSAGAGSRSYASYRGSSRSIEVDLPRIKADAEACNAFDRRPPLEAMATLWLLRANVVTVYDYGQGTAEGEQVYDAVFRLKDYVWIRSPAPVLRDELLEV